MEIKTILRDLCMAYSVGGVGDASSIIEHYLSAYTTDIHRDHMGNIWGVLDSEAANTPTILLEAHFDEIGFTVTHIDDNGFLRVAPCGGIDNRALSAAPVTILSNPPINGVFCSIPPHLNAGKDTTLTELTDRGIDVDMNAKQAKSTISIGTRVAFSPHFEDLLGERVCAKSLDNRAGVAAVLYALSLLANEALPVRVVALFSVQEELGMRGAKAATFGIQPDAAIAVDVSFAYTPDADKRCCGTMGKGAMLGISPILNETMTKALKTLAEESAIPYQCEVVGGATGTDADAISITAEGVPTALLSIPLRYMHTPSEVVDIQDIQSVGQLMAAFVKAGEVPSYA